MQQIYYVQFVKAIFFYKSLNTTSRHFFLDFETLIPSVQLVKEQKREIFRGNRLIDSKIGALFKVK